MYSSATTGHLSTIPVVSSRDSISVLAVMGVILSTMVTGNGTWVRIQASRSSSTSWANSRHKVRAIRPLLGMLSHERTVKGFMPRSFRSFNAATMWPNALDGWVISWISARTRGLLLSRCWLVSQQYPFSVMVRLTIFVCGSASRSKAASLSSGEWTKSSMAPMTEYSVFVTPLDMRVYRWSWDIRASCMGLSNSKTPSPTSAQFDPFNRAWSR
mmetsp:Transcript_8055/g.10898  ORF Transcript_8055/g.10898 Transcript_8055/m.10898 type:complete len:214 (-) Transcript_8055:636-1277(-)